MRSADEAKSGHIKGAVGMPAATVKGELKSFPPAKLQAPIIVYDGRGGSEAVAAARELIKSGQSNVQVMAGGLLGWQAAGLRDRVRRARADARSPTRRKPRPGSISIDEFTKLARNTPVDVLILDVRNPDEANAGMIKGAVLIPDEELAARMAELPKDKRIVAHCSTGIRAEMALPQAEGRGLQGRLPERGNRRREGRQLQDHAQVI